MSKQKQEKVNVFALGGVDELGKNMYVVEVNDEIIVLDAGLMLPENDMLGVDVVIPDIAYLLENRDRVMGIFLTHAHEDHIGALPYVLKQLNVPVYGTKLTLGLLEYKLEDTGLTTSAQLRLIDTDSELIVGKTKLSFFRTSHTIPDSIGICVHTSHGLIVHTGDFKFDYAPISQSGDIRKMAAIGEKGVLCLLSDSASAEISGITGSEMSAGQEISDAFYFAKGRIIVAAVASNIHRLQQIFDAARENGRKVAAVGRNIVKVIHIASDLGYLNIGDDVLVTMNGMSRLPDDECVLLASGSQGEPITALAQMANDRDHDLKIKPKDTVVIADNPIVGNEKTVTQTVDQLVRIGAEVVYNPHTAHDVGHASQRDLKLMLRLMTPKYFIPVHGEYRMLKVHSKLASELGIPDENIFIAEKGECIEFVDGRARRGGKVPSGKVLVDGSGIGDVGNIVLRDRKLLSEDGILLVVVTLGRRSKEILSGPEIISRGFVYVRESEELLNEANRIVTEVLTRSLNQNISEWSSLKSGIRDSLSRYLFDKTRRRPMILPIIMEV